jgi:FtsH-binding integral membrane protein
VSLKKTGTVFARVAGVMALVLAVAASSAYAGGIPDPGQGTAPPGSQGLLTILQWVAWIVFGLCVAGVLLAAGRMAISHNQGGYGGGESATLVKVLAACILAGSASALVGALA